MHSIIRCFADDTRISIAIRCENDVSRLQSDLYNVMRCSERNNMALQKDKFEYMCHKFNKNRSLPELPFVSELYQYTVSAETSLEPVHQLRDLGILISMPVICHGHPTFEPLQRRPDRKHHGFLVCSILDHQLSC